MCMYFWALCLVYLCIILSIWEFEIFGFGEKKCEETQTRDKEEAWFGEGGGRDDDGCMWKSTHMHACMQWCQHQNHSHDAMLYIAWNEINVELPATLVWHSWWFFLEEWIRSKVLIGVSLYCEVVNVTDFIFINILLLVIYLPVCM